MTILSTDASPASVDFDPTTIDPSTAVIENGVVVPDANAAESSTADVPDAKAPESLLDVVKSVIEKPAEPEVSSPAEGKEEVPAVVEEATQAEPKAEDDASLPFHNHPRWKAVLAERDTLREPAEQYGKITGFMETHGLVPDEVAEGFEIMALLKSGDPVKLGEAREWFHSRLSLLDASLGNVLPEDLQSRVEEGLIDEDSAAELARTRAAATLRTEQDTATAARTAEAARVSEATRTSNAMMTAVEGWEERTRTADPDYAKKAELIQTTCRAIVQRTGKAPTTAEEAVALADEALAEVNRLQKSLLPKPRPITPSPTGSSAIAAKAPSTLREAVEAGAARSR